MKRVWREGLFAPALVAAATFFVWLIVGEGWALLVLAVGAALLVAFHLHQLSMATDWAAGPLEAPVPDGRGPWAETFSALYRRTRLRQTVQRDLRQVIERFRNAAQAIPDGVILLDSRNRIEWANPRAVEQLGLDLQHDIGQPLINLLRVPEFLRYLDNGDFREPVLVEQQQQRRSLSLQIVPFGMEEKLLLCRDVTQLEAISRMRRDFIANVSHELKTPLTVVTGFLETMQDIDLDARQRGRYLGLMQDQARNMQRLVNDLLTLSALESEQNPAHDTAFAIVPLLLELSADAKALSRGEHAITLDIGRAASVVGSRDELKSAFGNLVSNAVRYTPQGGAIVLRWRIDDDGSGLFAVTDSGIGIAAEHIPRLTERFYRVDRSRSRATGGTGLGLAIVKHVLLRHRAELEVESTPGRGSTFSVRLPPEFVRPLADTSARDASDADGATSIEAPRDTTP
jgi:two-component system phosphate regulon sensor histidine kinase PhoR